MSVNTGFDAGKTIATLTFQIDENAKPGDTDTEPSIEDTALPTGDLDGNGKINAIDAHIILVAGAQYAVLANYNLTDSQISAADINSDSNLDAIDAHYVLVYSAWYNLRSHDHVTQKQTIFTSGGIYGA